MAKRLATVYVKTHIRLTEAEMMQFVDLFKAYDIHIQVRVYDNGNHEVVMEIGKGPDVTLNFELQHGAYVFEGSLCFYEPAPDNAMRKAIAAFKGTAVAQRHYRNFMIEYCYERGRVVSIIERRFDGTEQGVYRYRNSFLHLQELYERTDIEADIARTKEEINRLLDLRRQADPGHIAELDAKLAELSHRLFVLEA